MINLLLDRKLCIHECFFLKKKLEINKNGILYSKKHYLKYIITNIKNSIMFIKN